MFIRVERDIETDKSKTTDLRFDNKHLNFSCVNRNSSAKYSLGLNHSLESDNVLTDREQPIDNVENLIETIKDFERLFVTQWRPDSIHKVLNHLIEMICASPNIFCQLSTFQQKTLSNQNLFQPIDCASYSIEKAMEALVYSFELIGCKNKNKVLEAIAQEGIRLITKNLEHASCENESLYSKQKVIFGIILAQICFKLQAYSPLYALAYPVATTAKIPIDQAKRIMLPHWVEFNFDEKKDDYNKVVDCLVHAESKKNSMEGLQLLKNLVTKYTTIHKIRELQICKDEIVSMAYLAMDRTKLLNNNIRDLSFTNVIYLYLKAY